MKLRTTLLLPALLLTSTLLLAQDKPRVSPHETVTSTLADNEMKIVYGRPYTKDPKSGEPRKIWGELVPYGKVWRMGADEATLFTTKEAVTIGEKDIPAGTYSLYLLPAEDGAKLIVNKQTGQWGTKYDESQDLARIEMQRTKLDEPVNQFTIELGKTAADGVLKLQWESTQYSVSIGLKK